MAQTKPQYSRTFIGTVTFETEVSAREAWTLFCPVANGKTVFFNDPLVSAGPNGQMTLTISGEYVVHGNVPHDCRRFQMTAIHRSTTSKGKQPWVNFSTA